MFLGGLHWFIMKNVNQWGFSRSGMWRPGAEFCPGAAGQQRRKLCVWKRDGEYEGKTTVITTVLVIDYEPV